MTDKQAMEVTDDTIKVIADFIRLCVMCQVALKQPTPTCPSEQEALIQRIRESKCDERTSKILASIMIAHKDFGILSRQLIVRDVAVACAALFD